MSPGASFLFRVGGLVIDADTPLDGLRRLEDPEALDVTHARVRVRLRGAIGAPSVDETSSAWFISPYLDDRGVPLLTIWTVGAGYLLRYAEGTSFLVSDSGRDVDAWWDATLSEADAADYLLGGVLAFVVRLRGRVPLHASAVVIEDQAVLFAGSAGAGKSSLAAAFAILGYPVLSDDVVVMDDSGACVRAYPSYARLSLWSDSAIGLFCARTFPAHSPAYEKRRVDLIEHGYRFHDRPVPIGMICILATREASGSPPALRALSPQVALMNLVRHTYSNYLLDASLRSREFDVLGRIAASVRVSELKLGERLDTLVSDSRLVAERLALQSAAHVT
jgi:hypothetical protein